MNTVSRIAGPVGKKREVWVLHSRRGAEHDVEESLIREQATFMQGLGGALVANTTLHLAQFLGGR